MNLRPLCALAIALTTLAAACSSSSGGGTGAAGTSGGSAGTSGGAAGTSGSAGTLGDNAGTNGGSAGTTGSAGTSGAAGVNGTAGTTGSGNGGHAGAGAAGATAAGGTGTTASFCPSGALFCADFEEASGPPTNNPVGTATFEDPSEYGSTFGGASGAMTLDKTAPYDGSQSLKVTASSGFSVRTLAVSVPAKFWVRLYIKSDQAIGQMNHNSFFGPGTDPDYSKGNFVELSEQYGCVLLNIHDTTFPAGTSCGANTALSANAWHCMAAEFDGTTGNVQVFAGSTQIINAVDFADAQESFSTFEFGYFAYNPNSATVWYDDVVISTNSLSCPADS
ncbi:MAG TPA: hypothetical protein VFG23_24190 [Polyangia bacterium]|nr:hypothetical protein [Polyangia bacterium]